MRFCSRRVSLSGRDPEALQHLSTAPPPRRRGRSVPRGRPAGCPAPAGVRSCASPMRAPPGAKLRVPRLCPGLRSRAGPTTAANAGGSKVAGHASLPSARLSVLVTLEVPPAAEDEGAMSLHPAAGAGSLIDIGIRLFLERDRQHDSPPCLSASRLDQGNDRMDLEEFRRHGAPPRRLDGGLSRHDRASSGARAGAAGRGRGAASGRGRRRRASRSSGSSPTSSGSCFRE